MFFYVLVLACVYLTYRNKKYYNNFQRIKKSIEAKIPHLRLMKSHIAILTDRLNEIHQKYWKNSLVMKKACPMKK